MSPWAWYFWSRNLTGISGQSFNNEKKKKMTRFTSRIQARPTSLTPTSTNARHLPVYTITFNQSITDTFSFFSLPLQGSHGDCFVYLECGARFLNKWPDDEEDGDFTKTATAREEEWRGGKEEVKRCMYIKAWFLALTYFLFHCLKKERTLLFLVTYNSDTFTQPYAHIFQAIPAFGQNARLRLTKSRV